MRRKPVPGWTASASDLGLPGTEGVRYSPIGNTGDRAAFQVKTTAQWWVIGIDVSDGTSLFEPVSLGEHKNVESMLASSCYPNGPTMVVCLRGEGSFIDAPEHAWVVDTRSGALLYDGPTELRQAPDTAGAAVRRLGDYLVATIAGRGVFGIGPRAELTWHVPGSGFVSSSPDSDIAASPLAVQDGSGEPDVVFSVADGAVRTPPAPAGTRLLKATTYPGGFAYELLREQQFRSAGIAFYDNDGNPQGHFDGDAKLMSGSDVLPVARTKTADHVLTLSGRPLLELPDPMLMLYTRLVGTTLLISSDEDQRYWRQFDLRTGAEGDTCDSEEISYAYIGASADVVVVKTSTSPLRAIDLSTCETLWEWKKATEHEYRDAWRVNRSLILRVNDELSALVAPA
ncbi:hypothetical protein L2K20_19220 [Mycobacterium sp. MBM]|nr:hypothetical protein [Mycobacterium sp. MBM]